MTNLTFAHFTERSRRIMWLSEVEAKVHGQHLDAEHILLGFFQEGGGIGSKVLFNLGFNTPDIREKLRGAMVKSDQQVVEPALTARARRVVNSSRVEAGLLNHHYVGTEHILLALIKSDGLAGEILSEAGVYYEKVKEEVERILKMPGETKSS